MKFKCKATNLVYSFEFEADIAAMKQHPDYEAVMDEPEVKQPVKKTPAKVKQQDESSIDGAEPNS
jgi:hypothetical protein